MKPEAEIILMAIQYGNCRELFDVLLADKANDREAGRRLLLLAFIFSPEKIGTQRQLAKRMGVTEGRASQMLKIFRDKIPMNSNLG